MALRFRFLWPVTLASVGLIGLCAVLALSLLRQQIRTTQAMQENVASHRAATELEECLIDVVALLNEHVESVAVLHERTVGHLQSIRRSADQPEEQELVARLEEAFAQYTALWKAMPPINSPEHEPALRQVMRLLDTDLLRPCQELQQFNARRIEQAVEKHEWAVRQLAWGMTWIGMLGGGAGLVLGFGVARALSQSIRRLQFQIQDAAGKLGWELPQIVVTEEGDFRELHEQVDRLTARIEAIVQQLQQRDREVVRAEQLAAVGQLAAGVAHEIRNPLASIKMLVQAELEHGSPAGMPREDLQMIEGEVRRMERSLRTFLDFARPPRAERRPVAVGQLVDTVLGLIRGRADRQRVRVTVQVPDHDVTLTADPDQLQQVLVNLALNALDAMPGGGELTLTVRATAGGGVDLEVSDRGTGIPPEMMARLFQPFASTKDTGLGLGLVISRRIVEDHGGQIRAVNRLDGGCTFLVSLPPGQ
ncbi:MAG: ATP-binding protein [Gemmataceae bacterium]